MKQATVSKEVGKWFISFAVVFEIEQPAMKTLDVGIDLGVVHAVTISDGLFFDLDTEAIKAQELKIAKLQRQLSLNASSRKKLAKKKLAEPFDKTNLAANAENCCIGCKKPIRKFATFVRISTRRRRTCSRKSTAVCTLKIYE